MTPVVLAFWLAVAQAQDPAAMNETAKQLTIERRYDEAEKVWKQALAASPDFFPALFNLGFLYFSRAHYEQAEPLLARASRIQPGDFNARYILGSTLVNLSRREAGLVDWRAAIGIQPKNFKLMQIMAVEYSKGRYFQEAALIARRALELRSDDPDAYFIAIKACQDAGDAAAMEIARRAAEKFPDSARANFEYGYHLQKIGRNAEALPYLKKAMAADPAYEEPFFFYGDSMLSEGRNEEAIPYLRIAIRDRPDYVTASVALARALMRLERYDEALKELARIISLSPRHPEPHLLLSQLYFRMGDEERARAEKEISLRLRREDPTIMEVPLGRPFPVETSRSANGGRSQPGLKPAPRL
jgi:tetratricopeptide (TPR) repeat protein